MIYSPFLTKFQDWHWRPGERRLLQRPVQLVNASDSPGEQFSRATSQFQLEGAGWFGTMQTPVAEHGDGWLEMQ